MNLGVGRISKNMDSCVGGGCCSSIDTLDYTVSRSPTQNTRGSWSNGSIEVAAVVILGPSDFQLMSLTICGNTTLLLLFVYSVHSVSQVKEVSTLILIVLARKSLSFSTAFHSALTGPLLREDLCTTANKAREADRGNF
eukprot:1128367-Amphidinium_carterae.1